MSESATITSLGVELFGVTRRFPNGVTPFERLDLRIAAADFVAILGPSGCGKSTLLRLMAELDQPQTGDVRIEHLHQPKALFRYRGLPKARGQIAYVFQDAHLLPWRTVRDNVALPLELMHGSPARLKESVAEAIEQVGLTEAIDRYPAQLSGGMRMRVSLARAMVTQPRLLLLDEPFAALDEITRSQLDSQLRDLWLTRRMTVVFVTHSTTEAAFLSERAIVMARRPGRIVDDVMIDLPAERSDDLRATREFAEQTQKLFQALQRGGAQS